MPTLRDIKRRIKAVQSTSKITKAMKMVAAAKFRKSAAAHVRDEALCRQDELYSFKPCSRG